MDALKILVVDDESRMRKLVRDFLTKKNFQVLEAGNGEEAMDIFYNEKDIALIILDVMMPKMDGWEVCRLLPICPVTFCPSRWMYPNSASFLPEHRKIWGVPV